MAKAKKETDGAVAISPSDAANNAAAKAGGDAPAEQSDPVDPETGDSGASQTQPAGVDQEDKEGSTATKRLDIARAVFAEHALNTLYFASDSQAFALLAHAQSYASRLNDKNVVTVNRSDCE